MRFKTKAYFEKLTNFIPQLPNRNTLVRKRI